MVRGFNHRSPNNRTSAPQRHTVFLVRCGENGRNRVVIVCSRLSRHTKVSKARPSNGCLWEHQTSANNRVCELSALAPIF